MKETAFLIRKRRVELNYSQQYMADKLGISQPGYAKIEQGNTKIDLLRLLLISNVLEFDPLILFKGRKTTEQIITEPTLFVENLYIAYKKNTQNLIDTLKRENNILNEENKRLLKLLEK